MSFRKFCPISGFLVFLPICRYLVSKTRPVLLLLYIYRSFLVTIIEFLNHKENECPFPLTKPTYHTVMNITHSNSCILISKLCEIDATKITLKLLTHPSTSFLL